MTGAFHEDGLADTADGLFGGHDRARRLEIMRDSRVGTYGVVALVLVLGAQVTALAALPPSLAWRALVAAHALGRAAALPLTLLPYARAEGGLGAARRRSACRRRRWRRARHGRGAAGALALAAGARRRRRRGPGRARWRRAAFRAISAASPATRSAPWSSWRSWRPTSAAAAWAVRR